MARFILKWRYIRSGSPKHNQNLVKYIATREGVEKCDESWKHQPATQQQQRLIKELIEDFPDSIQNFEYQDYIAAQTKSTASEFINRTIEENVDLIGKKENYVGYIAMRPRVEKQGAHGLFTQNDEVINLSEVARTVAEHEGAVWTTILSLRREDAERLGYDNAKAWRDMLRGQADKLAKAMGIPLVDLRWYGAFHNEGSHPHLHLISYSVGKEPYMTEQGLLRFKSDFAGEIFKHDLYHIYQDQTAHRDELRRTGREKMADIVKQINSGVYENEIVTIILRELVRELDHYKGKMVYGYMPKKAKNLIDGIVDELAKDERIAELYSLWYEQRDHIIRTYQDTMTQRIPLSQNKEFKTIKNAVIQEALNILHNQITFEDEGCEHPEMTMGDEAEEAKENISWTDPENMNDQYCRAKSCLNEAAEDFNSEELLKKVAMQGSSYAKYALAKMHLKGQASYSSIAFAVQLLTEAADQGNQWAEYQLGKMYLYGQGVDMNYDLAVRLLSSSANKENEYAQRLLENESTYSQNNFAMALASLRLLTWIAQILQEDILKNDDIHSRIEKKVRRRIEEKKMAQGIKPE